MAETVKKLQPIPVDENQIRAVEKARNGANCHAVGETLENYRHWCARGVETNARQFKWMLYFLATGATTNYQIAYEMAATHIAKMLQPRYIGTEYEDYWKEAIVTHEKRLEKVKAEIEGRPRPRPRKAESPSAAGCTAYRPAGSVE